MTWTEAEVEMNDGELCFPPIIVRLVAHFVAVLDLSDRQQAAVPHAHLPRL